MPDAGALRTMIEVEQAEFTQLARTLTADQWQTPSLCRGWSVHDVVTHIALHIHTTAPQRIRELATLRFSETRQLARHRPSTTDALVEWLGSEALLAGRTNMLTQLSELVVHQQDVRRPLGASRTIPEATLLAVLEFSLTRVGSLSVTPTLRRAKGLRLVATDLEWTRGSGPEVRGAAEAIIIAVHGRPTAVPDLEGDGVATLADRIQP
jgi:uncharacterized protein (TIGR03083 family)